MARIGGWYIVKPPHQIVSNDRAVKTQWAHEQTDKRVTILFTGFRTTANAAIPKYKVVISGGVGISGEKTVGIAKAQDIARKFMKKHLNGRIS